MKRVLWIILFLAVAFGGHAAAKLQYQITETLDFLDRESGLDLDNVEVSNDQLAFKDQIINILLVGADKRDTWNERGRSDSVMIATVDKKHKELKLTSLMRDMYVTIPGHDNTRFNAAYSYGGISLLYQTIAANFGIRLDGYVIVDFAAFRDVINKLGGVEIELTDAEYQYLIQTYADKNNSVKNVKPGLNRMNGTQALAYTRIRKDANGDFGRTQRQRNVMEALFKEAKSMPITKLKELAQPVLQSVTTDLTNEEVMSYILAVVMMGTTEIKQLRIPVDGGYGQDRINNQAILTVDWEMNKKALYNFIFGENNGLTNQ